MTSSLRAILMIFASSLIAPAPPALAEGSSPSPAVAADPNFVAGKQAIDEKNWARAIESLKKAAANDPRSADIQNYLGYAYRNSGQMDLAFMHYEKALSIDPNHRGAHEYFGEAYLMVNNLAKAEEHRVALDRICFFPCHELTELKEKIAAYRNRTR